MNHQEASRPTSAAVLRYWGPVLLWMAVISTLSGDPFSAQNTHNFIDPILRYLFPDISAAGFRSAHFFIRKGAHFTEFFVLGVLTFLAWRRGRQPSWRLRWAVQTMALVVVCALADEGRQAFVPTRGPSLYDSLIDSLGGLASQIVLFAWFRLIRGQPLGEDPA